MTRVILRMLVLGVPFAAFLAWFESVHGGQGADMILIKKRLIEAAKPGVEVLCLGSSHTADGVRPLLVDPHAFNLASWGQSLYYDCALVHEYRDRLSRLRLVVLAISYFSLEYELDQGVEPWRAYYYRKAYGIAHRDWRLETQLRNYSTWFLLGRDTALEVMRGDPAQTAVLGGYDAAGGLVEHPVTRMSGFSTKRDELRASALASRARHSRIMQPENVDENGARLAASLRFLDERGIGAVLITLPTSTYYREGLRPAVLAQTAEVLGTLTRDLGVKWYDYSADSRFSDDDFLDADHLNFAGAGKFSRMLAGEVVQPMLAGAPAPRR